MSAAPLRPPRHVPEGSDDPRRRHRPTRSTKPRPAPGFAEFGQSHGRGGPPEPRGAWREFGLRPTAASCRPRPRPRRRRPQRAWLEVRGSRAAGRRRPRSSVHGPGLGGEPGFYSLRLLHGYLCRAASSRLLDASAVDALTDQGWRFFARLADDALAPTNSFWTNPAVVKRAYRDRRRERDRGACRLTSTTSPTTTAGRARSTRSRSWWARTSRPPRAKVVFRNELMELIQYAPATERSTPRRCCSARPGSTSTTSWTSPPAQLRRVGGESRPDGLRHQLPQPGAPSRPDVTLDDYLSDGPPPALDVIEEITGAETRRMSSGCAWAARSRRSRPPTWPPRATTAIASTHPAEYAARLQPPRAPGGLHRRAAPSSGSRGRWPRRATSRPRRSMATIFDLLRPNDLIWNYVVSNWLMGAAAPAFDILAWNADSTRMPANMHSFYLRTCYLENELAGGRSSLPANRSGSTWGRSSRTPTSSAPRRTTSPRGRSATPPSSCCRTGAVRSSAVATSPASSTRRAPRAGTGSRRDAAVADGMAGEGGPARRIVVGGLGWLVT